MQIIELTDTCFPGAEAYFHLTDAQMRSRQEPEKGIFIAEGPKVVGTALDNGYQPISILMRRKFLETVQGRDLIQRAGDVPVFTADDDLLAEITGFKLQRSWILSAMRRRQSCLSDEIIVKAKCVAVLEGITEPSNLGAIFRSAAAMGIDGILISPNCCDPYHRRAVRVCMGSLFSVPWARTEDDLSIPMLKQLGFTCIGLTLQPDSIPLYDEKLANLERTALFLGTEDTGLSAGTIDKLDMSAIIPMRPGIDSLNVAAAAAIAFWEFAGKHR